MMHLVYFLSSDKHKCKTYRCGFRGGVRCIYFSVKGGDSVLPESWYHHENARQTVEALLGRTGHVAKLLIVKKQANPTKATNHYLCISNHDFISSRLDYCNALYFSITKWSMQTSQHCCQAFNTCTRLVPRLHQSLMPFSGYQRVF